MGKSIDLSLFDPETKKNIQKVLEGNYSSAYKRELLDLYKKDPEKLKDAFYKKLSFGTGGIRGLLGVGTNRLNIYTIHSATQGLANYINKQATHKRRVFISYDNRKNSSLFAKEAARVLAGNAIEVFIVKDLRPTPLCSFGCIYYHCIAAIMITASHNPPEYNGYKVYWDDGAQVLPPHDKGIISEVEAIEKLDQISLAPLKSSLIHWVGKKLDQIYLESILAFQNLTNSNQKKGKELSIIYTNLHGTGDTIIPYALKEWGFSKLVFVASQKKHDPNFPGAKKPNPEEKEALTPGAQLLLEQKADLLLASDPDADRIAAVIRHKGKPILFTGNQMAALLLHHLITVKNLPSNSAFVKSIVTTELFQRICDHHQFPCFNVLTGFKYIAEKIREWEMSSEYHFAFGAEESLGYLASTIVRDKDAALSATLIAEMALKAKLENKTLLDRLHELYKSYGLFREKLISISFPEGKRSMQLMKSLLEKMRKSPPVTIGGKRVKILQDYLIGKSLHLTTRKKSSLSMPKSDVLAFWLEDETKIIVRPSGTEPKIKIYLGVMRKKASSIASEIEELDQKLEKLGKELQKHFQAKS